MNGWSARNLSRPQIIENSRQYFLLRTDIHNTENSRWFRLFKQGVSTEALKGYRSINISLDTTELVLRSFTNGKSRFQYRYKYRTFHLTNMTFFHRLAL